jgi:hypothetical protein
VPAWVGMGVVYPLPASCPPPHASCPPLPASCPPPHASCPAVVVSGGVSVGSSGVFGVVVLTGGVHRVTWQWWEGRDCDVAVVAALLGVVLGMW